MSITVLSAKRLPTRMSDFSSAVGQINAENYNQACLKFVKPSGLLTKVNECLCSNEQSANAEEESTQVEFLCPTAVTS